MEPGEYRQSPTLIETIQEKSKDLFLTEERTGIIGETLIDFQGGNFLLRYSIIEPKNRKPTKFRISLFDNTNADRSKGKLLTPQRAIQLEDHELSTIEFSLEPEDEAVRIELENVTRVGFEGKQFSSALAFASDSVIEDFIARRPEQFYDKDIYATIVDDAQAADPQSGIQRNGWSSWIAQQLGYQRTGNYKGKPQFIKEFY